MRKLDQKVAVITGCASELGKQHTIRFAHEGAKLAIAKSRKATVGAWQERLWFHFDERAAPSTR